MRKCDHASDSLIRCISTILCEQGIISLSTLVDQNPGVSDLNLGHNRIDDTYSAICFSEHHLGLTSSMSSTVNGKHINLSCRNMG